MSSLILILGFLAGTGNHPRVSHDQAIYQLVFNHTNLKSEVGYIVIDKTGSRDLQSLSSSYLSNGEIDFDDYTTGKLDTSWLYLIKEAKKNSEKEKRLKKEYFGPDVLLYPKGDIDNIFKLGVDEGWKKFYLMYPLSKGFRNFSKIIYSSDNSRAIVCMSRREGGMNGGGSAFFLVNNGTNWQIICETVLWMS